MSEDGTIVVAGAPYATVGSNSGQGAVYVFAEPASGWANGTQAAELTASDGAYYDTLGWSVAMSPGGTTVVAGAYGKGNYQGAVYVFKEPASGWANGTQAAELTASDAAAEDYMGDSVAVSTDGRTVVAGAYGKGGYQGAVYVFKEPASGWANGTQAAELTASDAAYAVLGWSVAISSDGTVVAAGAPYTTVGSNSGQGAVYVFAEPASGWANGTQVSELTASDGATSDNLGSSVAVSSDDLFVVAGAAGATVGGNNGQGAVYIFHETVLNWVSYIQEAKLTASDGAPYASLGTSVAVSQSEDTVVAGAPGATVGVNDYQGAVYVFDKPGPSGWVDGTEAAKLTESNGGAASRFGWSVTVTSDGAIVFAGARGATFGSILYEGAVYVFQGSLWQDATNFGDGWDYLSWFGFFNINSYPWIYHFTLGWLYPLGTSTFSIWFYDPQWDGTGGWWWTGNLFYPWVYSETENAWLYYDATITGARWFYNSSTGQWGTH